MLFSRAYIIARVRTLASGSPVLRLMAQRDHAYSDAVLLEREVAIYRSQRYRYTTKQRPHFEPQQRAEILQLMRLRNWSPKQTAERFVLHPNTIRNWQKAVVAKHRRIDLIGGPRGINCTQRCDGLFTRSAFCAPNATLEHERSRGICCAPASRSAGHRCDGF